MKRKEKGGKRGILRSPAAVDSARLGSEIKFSVSDHLTDAFEVLEFPLCPPFLSGRQPDPRRGKGRESYGEFLESSKSPPTRLRVSSTCRTYGYDSCTIVNGSSCAPVGETAETGGIEEMEKEVLKIAEAVSRVDVWWSFHAMPIETIVGSKHSR
ncbi:hypothetical protein V6N13_005783 [Hibiscus sabdariffa]|uniref:Uncharacterized protein n=1 Tax=Hibiscus sabdariffa TaxID=183260 RepID=A0ABR2EPR8_9ROSI